MLRILSAVQRIGEAAVLEAVCAIESLWGWVAGSKDESKPPQRPFVENSSTPGSSTYAAEPLFISPSPLPLDKSRRRKTHSKARTINRLVPTSPHHAWLVSLPIGTEVDPTVIFEKLGVSATEGWHEKHGVVLAALIATENLKERSDQVRLKLNNMTYHATIELAAITVQAVPVFTSVGTNWQFRGFFHFHHPAGQSVRCRRLDALPEELIAAMTQLAGG